MSYKSMAVLIAIALLGIVNANGQSMEYRIEGITWLDIDDNGIRTIEDKIVPQVKVDLFNEQGAMIQFTTSGTNGNYSFSNLDSGIYYLKFEKKQGLKMALTDAGDDIIDSDVESNAITPFILLDDSTPTINLDAGFRSSIIIQTKAFIHVCEGELIEINPIILDDGGDLSYNWDHDGSSESSTSLIVQENTLIKFTVTDIWGIPVEKNIFIKLTYGVSSKECADVDIFDFSEVPINIFVSDDNPGPISVTDTHENFIGGGRTISIELLEGENISSINSSDAGVFINNCSGCKTSTTLTYFSPTNEYLDISKFDYFELTEMIIDQGNIAVSISVTDDVMTSTLSNKIESEGPNTDILPIFFFENFDNFDQIDFSKLRTISLTFTSINESIDILMSSILSCQDEQCFTTLLESQDICLLENSTLTPKSTCTDGLIYFWEDLGFGKEKVVSPIDTTLYNLTVFDQNGCSETLSTLINVKQPPQLELENPSKACFNENIKVEANTTSGQPAFSYQWSNTSMDSPFIEIEVTSDTTIYVTVIDSLGCTAVAATSIIAHENPSVTLSISNTLCSQPSGSLKAQISGGSPPYSLEWSNGITNQDSITKLDYGIYTLEVIDSLGCSTTASAMVNYLPCAAIGNYVWHDINYNGIQDSIDLPLPNIIVLLKNHLDEEINRDTTNENGIYLFDGLEGGEYYVEYIPPFEFYPTLSYASSDEMVDSNADSITHKSNKITLLEYEKNLTIDAGWYKKACLGDQVWNDINLNHYIDSLDIGIENVIVKLLDCELNILDSTSTDGFGNYSFCDLDPGEYSLQFCAPAGLVPVQQNVGDETIDSDINPKNGISDCKILLSGDSLSICDAGFYNISSIGDYIWHDQNANGIQDQSESPIEGVSLELYRCNGQLLTTTITDSVGYYIFDSLAAGTYFIEIIPFQDAKLTQDNMGLDSLKNSDFSMIDHRTTCIELPAGIDRIDIDGGLYYEASIGDYVWNDYDLDGLQGSEELAVENLKIYLYSCDNNLIDSTYSDEHGYYLFDELRPDKYKIKVELNDAQKLTIINNNDSVHNNDIDDNSLVSECVTLASSEDHVDLDIGIYNLGKIGDLVWFDENGNGIQDGGEGGFSEVTIRLLDCDENTISTVESNANGEYCFSEIPYGEYKVHFDVPEPYYLVNALAGNAPLLDSDPDPTSHLTKCITLSTPIDSSLDAGIATCTTIGGIAWFDGLIMNNVKDQLENGVNGIIVKAFKNTNGQWNLDNTTYTSLKPGHFSEDGYWEMCVSPGEYYFEFSNIPVIEAVLPNQGSDDFLDSDVVHTFGINTTDIINVLPGIDNVSIGIGYRWKNSFNKLPNSINSQTSKIIYNELEPSLIIEDSSAERSKHINLRDSSILENSTSEKTNLYPNPTSGYINIYIPDPIVEPIDFVIYENTGRQIKIPSGESIFKNKTLSIQVKDFHPGLYYLKILNKDKIEWLPFIKI